jgi:hypothetical protein
MAVHELTNCVPKGSEGTLWLRMTLSALGFGSIWGFVAFVAAGGSIFAGAFSGILAAVYAGMIAFCDWFFNSRLICQADSDILLGILWTTEESFDGDFCLNILPAPFHPGNNLLEMTDPNSNKAPQARYLLNPWPGEMSFNAQHVKIDNADPNKVTPLVHTEIEGTKMQTWCIATIAALAAALFASIVIMAAAGCGPFSWLCLLIGLAILAIAALISVIGHEVGDSGSTADVGVDPAAKTVRAEDHPTIAIEGRRIYDAGHEGWIELHAVRKIVSVSQEDHDNFDDSRLKKIIALLDEARDPSVQQKQDDLKVATHAKLG